MMRAEDLEWDECVDKVLYGYRRRRGNDSKAPFEIMYGIMPRFPGENSINQKSKEQLVDARLFELALA